MFPATDLLEEPDGTAKDPDRSALAALAVTLIPAAAGAHGSGAP